MMKKTVLTGVAILSVLWLSGCMVIDCEEYGPPDEVCVVPGPPVVEVFEVPGPPRPYYHHYPHYRHDHHPRWR